MGFGKPFAQKPRTPEPVRPVTGALVRIVILGLLAAFGAAWGIYLYYTHAFRPKPAPASTSAPPASGGPATVDAGEVEIQLQ